MADVDVPFCRKSFQTSFCKGRPYPLRLTVLPFAKGELEGIFFFIDDELFGRCLAIVKPICY
jgi:hypothetical protein